MTILKRFISILTLTLFIVSCSSDDDSNTNPPTNPTTNEGNYFPLTVDNYWNYDVAFTDNNDPNNNSTSNDFLFVDSQSGNSFNLGVNTANVANGSMNTVLVNGTLERIASSLLLDGSLQLPIPGFESNSINYTDMILYDLNAIDNSQLASVSGSFSQDIDAGGTIVPVIVNYTITTNQMSNNNTITVNGNSYSGVSQANFKVSMSLVATVENPFTGLPLNLNILNTQDVLNITNYFSENVGLIKADAEITYQLDQTTIDLLSTFGVTIPFPTSGSTQNVQELTDFVVATE